MITRNPTHAQNEPPGQPASSATASEEPKWWNLVDAAPNRIVHMKPVGRAQVWGYIRVLLLAFISPISVIVMAPILGFGFLYTIFRKHLPTASYDGSDAAVSIELVIALIVIPILGLFGTAGTSVAFYLLAGSESHPFHSIFQYGWQFLIFTVVVTVLVISMVIRSLANHRYGSDVWHFESDVDAAQGRKRVDEIRFGSDAGVGSRRAPGFLPERFIGAALWADELASHGENVRGTLTFRNGWGRAAIDRKQYKILYAGSGIWVLLWLLGIWHKPANWCLLLILIASSLVSSLAVRAAAARTLQLETYRQLRLANREIFLCNRIKNDKLSIERIEDRTRRDCMVDQLALQISALTALLEQQSQLVTKENARLRRHNPLHSVRDFWTLRFQSCHRS